MVISNEVLILHFRNHKLRSHPLSEYLATPYGRKMNFVAANDLSGYYYGFPNAIEILDVTL